MLIVFLVVGGFAAITSMVAFLTLCERENRSLSVVFMIELVGRWWQIPADRRDPWISSAAVGYMIAVVSVIGCVALGGV